MKRIPVLAMLILAGILAFQWVGRTSVTPSDAPLSETGMVDSISPQTQPDLLDRLDTGEPRDHYASIVERPLFRPDRRPPPPNDERSDSDISQEDADLSAFDLDAVLITPDTLSAWVRDPAQPKLRRIRIGDDLLGWSVIAIEPERVLVERQGRQDTLILRDYSKASPVTAPPAPVRKSLPRPSSRTPVRAEPPQQ